MHVPLFDLDEQEADLDPSDTETESPLNYEAITNRKTLNQLYKLYWDSLETEQYDGCSPSFIFREAEKTSGQGRVSFLFSLLGYGCNLGNVWRFPYIAYNNGGGAFLIAFVIMLVVIGFPMLFLELTLGQFSNLGPVGTHEKLCPIFQGIGYSVFFISIIVSFYYNIILAWSIFYIFASLSASLPWEHCNPSWNSEDCCDIKANHCLGQTVSYHQATNVTANSSIVQSVTTNFTITAHKTPPQAYFENVILDLSQDAHGLGQVHWPIVLSLLLAWCLIFLSTCTGVKSSSKVACLTVPFSCITLLTVFIRAVSLDGAREGVVLFFKPDFHKLASAEIWVEAAVQTFYTLGPVLGGLVTFSSHNLFHNNCFKDSIILFLFSSGTSIFTGIALFSALGFVANKYDTNTTDVINKGVGFIFEILPEIVLELPTAPFWSFVVFAMLLMVGINSQIALVGTVTSAVLEKVTFVKGRKTPVVLCICLSGFLLGISMCTQRGIFILQLLDFYTARWAVLLLAIAECVIIGWIYGSDMFLRDVEIMTGHRGMSWHWYFTIFWKFLIPVTLAFLLILSWVQFEPLQLESYNYPDWVQILGCCISLLPALIIILLAIVKIITAGRQLPCLQRLQHLLRPTFQRGPAHHTTDIAAALERITNDKIKPKNSFENPTYNVVYTFETNM